jgi:hypothetical protein
MPLILPAEEHQTERKQFRIIATVAISPSCQPVKEDPVYAAIRQGKAKTGMAEELTRRIKEGAPFRSSVMFRALWPTMWSMRQTIL